MNCSACKGTGLVLGAPYSCNWITECQCDVGRLIFNRRYPTPGEAIMTLEEAVKDFPHAKKQLEKLNKFDWRKYRSPNASPVEFGPHSYNQDYLRGFDA